MIFSKLQRYKRGGRGFSIVETLIVLGILVFLVLATTLFQRNIFSYNTYIQSSLGAQMDGRRTIMKMVSEMREMSPSSLGSYPIAAAATSSITFYSDIDADSVKEQIRYYIQGTQVLKSVINPTGAPLVYNSGSAVVTTVIQNVSNGTSTPLFQYYDTNYAGTTTALSLPINISSVKLVKITLLLPERSSGASNRVTITSQVTPRNLKDNL